VVAGDVEAAAAAVARGALDDVHARPVVRLHVQFAGGEAARLSRAEVACHSQRLEEELRRHHGGAHVDHHAAVVKGRQGAGDAAEVVVAGGADGGGVLVFDLGAERPVTALVSVQCHSGDPI
jgi:hypothetical protein